MFTTNALAYDIAVKNADGVTIYYDYINNGAELAVTSNNNAYKGIVNIPEEVTYNGKTRKVTSIEVGAFQECNDLTSVTIPNSVINIEAWTFYGCI